jgi:predicted dehydrogenase
VVPASGETNNMARKVRVGVIGSGGIATAAHMPGYKADPDCEIVALCDLNAEAAKKAAEKFEVEKIYSDYRELAADPDIEAVSVCTPNFMHMVPTIACLEAGKHVIVEKPIALDATEGAAMVRAAKKAGKLLAVGLHFRYDPKVNAIRRFFDKKGFGDVYYARVHALRRRGIPSWGVFGDKEKQGGGPLIDIGVHMLYATMYAMGFPVPVAVSGQTYQKFGAKKPGVAPWGPWDHKGFTVEDYASAFVRFEGGQSLVIESSFCMNGPDGMNFWIMGDKGGAQFSPLRFFREEFGTLTNTEPGWMPKADCHTQQMLDFVNAVRGKGKVGVTGEEGLCITQILDAIYASAEAGKEVPVRKLKL